MSYLRWFIGRYHTEPRHKFLLIYGSNCDQDPEPDLDTQDKTTASDPDPRRNAPDL